jgi:hypothetical protein
MHTLVVAYKYPWRGQRRFAPLTVLFHGAVRYTRNVPTPRCVVGRIASPARGAAL